MIWRLLAAAILALLPSAAGAHGEHGGHGDAGPEPQGTQSVVTVQGYRMEFLSEPAPLVRGQAGRVVVKVQPMRMRHGM